MNVYETERLVGEYLLFHFGSDSQVLPWPEGPREALGFPKRIVDRFSAGEVGRALDLGCAVGRSSFELSKTTRKVIGIDYSQAFVAAARLMRDEGRIEIKRHEEGSVFDPVVVSAPKGIDPGRISFEQGDAMDLRPDLGTFDRVLAANLLCRLSDPPRLLERLPALVVPGGELLLTTPCTWLEEFTPTDHWPEGTTLEWLEDSLGRNFDLVGQSDEPFLIREHARKYQWSVALLTRWRRR